MTELVRINPQSVEVKLRCPSLEPDAYDHADILLQLNPNLTVDELRQFLIKKEVIQGRGYWRFRTLNQHPKQLTDEETMSSLAGDQTYLMCYPDENGYTAVRQPQTGMMPQNQGFYEPGPNGMPADNNRSTNNFADNGMGLGPTPETQMQQLVRQIEQQQPLQSNQYVREPQRMELPIADQSKTFKRLGEAQLEDTLPPAIYHQEGNLNSANVSPNKSLIRNEDQIIGTNNQLSPQKNTTTDNFGMQPMKIAGTTQAAGGEACCCSMM